MEQHVPRDTARTDPEFARVTSRFEAETAALSRLGGREGELCALSALIGADEEREFAPRLEIALSEIPPEAAREVIYQSAAYLGHARAARFLSAANAVFSRRGVSPPLPPEGTVSDENRFSAGTDVLARIFGPDAAEIPADAPEDAAALRRLLAENCFGDYYTRGGLSLRERELAAFCFLIAAGFGPAQVKARVVANFALGADAETLTAVVARCLPIIGWPRAMDALAAISQTRREFEEDGGGDLL